MNLLNSDGEPILRNYLHYADYNSLSKNDILCIVRTIALIQEEKISLLPHTNIVDAVNIYSLTGDKK